MPTVEEVKAALTKEQLELLDIEVVGKYIIITPKKYLAKKWQPIMDALNKAFGKLVEWPRGLGKQSHWRVLINGGAVTGSTADFARRIDNIIAQLMELKNNLAGNTK